MTFEKEAPAREAAQPGQSVNEGIRSAGDDITTAAAGQRAKLCFPTGFGQSDTRAKTLSDGRPNPGEHAGKPYQTITASMIAKLVREPPSVAKGGPLAQWFVPSSYAEHDARSHDAQRQRGAFWWLALDLDENDWPIGELDDILCDTLGDVVRLIYSTASATAENRKWRALVPLKEPISGADYSDTQSAFFDLLEENSRGALIADRALARPAQLVYLPNAGASFYEHRLVNGDKPRLHLDAAHPVIRKRDETRQARAEAEREAAREREKRIAKRKARAEVEGESPVDHFNGAHSVADLLARYGYTQAGSSKDWKSPFQSSGSYATRDCGEFWISLSGSDDAQEIGQATQNGHRFGDAFDLFVHFEHGGDFNAAVAAYGAEIRPAQPSAAQSRTHVPDAAATAPTSDGEPRPNEPDDDRIDLSHDALANEMGRRDFDGRARFVSLWGKWMLWDGTRWAADERLEAMTRTREFLRQRAHELVEWAERKAAESDPKDADKVKAWADQEARTLRNKNTVAAIESLARSNSASVASPDQFDADKLLLGTPGGTVDLRTGILRRHRREDYISKLTSVPPQSGTPERWLRFLHEIFDGDAELIAFMQRAAGYALTGMTTEHKLLFLYGTGRNGKSVFLNTLFWLAGDYARRAAAQTFLNSTGDKHPTDLAGLQGARLVAGSELPKGKTWDESVIKDLTGGDTMTARYMRQDFFDFEPQLTLMIAGNNQPSFRGVDEAIRARVVLVPFTVTIPPEKRDKGLEEKLRAEGGKILQWAIEGALEWQRRGLDVPSSVAAASEEYLDGEDVLGTFLEDETQHDAMSFITTTALHQRFTQWCESQGLNSWTLRTLQKEVRARGYEPKSRNIGKGFIGLKLR